MKTVNPFRVAIVGRPNVGKSSLFNRLTGARTAIVDQQSGITRDRIYGKVSFKHRAFDLIDTGGFLPKPADALEVSTLEQLEQALSEADLILFLLEAGHSRHPDDFTMMERVRKIQKPMFLVVNKVDHEGLESAVHEYHRLGPHPLYSVSVLHNRGIAALLEAILTQLPPDAAQDAPFDRFKICIVGKPNVGKSSLVNCLIGESRMIVSSLPGTTRDAVAVDWTGAAGDYTLIDTAGLMRRSKFKEPVESYAVLRARDAIHASQMSLLILDASRSVERQDMRIARMIDDAGRCCLIVVNKWDLVREVRQEHYLKFLRKTLPGVTYAPVLFASMQTGKGASRILPAVQEIRENAFRKIPTSVVNAVFRSAFEKTPPPAIAGRPLRLYYVTQTATLPATFQLFINSKRRIAPHYEAYLRNQVRAALALDGMPIRLLFRDKTGRASKRPVPS